MKRIFLIVFALLVLSRFESLADNTTPQRFIFDEHGLFKVVHITDIQDVDPPKQRTVEFIDNACAHLAPDLVILTGDNTASNNRKGNFEKAVQPFVDIFKNRKIPFAVTFGNHDSERRSNDHYTRDEQYAVLKEMGGSFFVDFDVQELSGTGSGVIPLNTRSGKVVFNLFVIDSGDYGEGGRSSGYGGVFSDQIEWYEKVSSNIPSLWFQHIIVPDIYETGLLVEVPQKQRGAVEHENRFYVLNEALANGLLLEPPCPTATKTYNDEKHTWEGRTLYASWLKMRNMKGAYFGHDHKNTFEGTDKNNIRLGYTKAATLHSYNDNNPGLRFFNIRSNGEFTTRIVTEKDLKNEAGND